MQVFMGVRKCSSKKILCLHYGKLTIAVLGPGRGLRRKGMLEGAVVVGWACSLPNPGPECLGHDFVIHMDSSEWVQVLPVQLRQKTQPLREKEK